MDIFIDTAIRTRVIAWSPASMTVVYPSALCFIVTEPGAHFITGFFQNSAIIIPIIAITPIICAPSLATTIKTATITMVALVSVSARSIRITGSTLVAYCTSTFSGISGFYRTGMWLIVLGIIEIILCSSLGLIIALPCTIASIVMAMTIGYTIIVPLIIIILALLIPAAGINTAPVSLIDLIHPVAGHPLSLL